LLFGDPIVAVRKHFREVDVEHRERDERLDARRIAEHDSSKRAQERPPCGSDRKHRDQETEEQSDVAQREMPAVKELRHRVQPRGDVRTAAKIVLGLERVPHHADEVAKDVAGGSLRLELETGRDLIARDDRVARAREESAFPIVFITYRAAALAGYDYYAGGRPVDMGEIVYSAQAPKRLDIGSRDVVAAIQDRYPDFAPAAYLNGTEKPDSFKWLLALRAGSRRKIHGYFGPKFVEATQVGYHFAHGRYLAYAPSWLLGLGRAALIGSLWDRGARTAAAAYLRDLASKPQALRDRVHMQAIMVIQPIDMLEDGRQNMCDGCPDMTLHEGRLAWSCRLEELRRFGTFVTSVPKATGTPPAAAE
jgi:hypothetical protein